MAAPATRERLIRPCLPCGLTGIMDVAKRHFPTALAQAEACADCLVTDPATGKWVTGCPSNAAPA